MRDELLRRGARIGLIEALMMGNDARVDALLAEQALPQVVPSGSGILAFARTTHAIDRLLARGASTDGAIGALSALGERGAPLVRHLIAREATASPREYARLGDLAALQKDPAVARIPEVLMAAVDHARVHDQSRQTPLHAAAWQGDRRRSVTSNPACDAVAEYLRSM